MEKVWLKNYLPGVPAELAIENTKNKVFSDKNFQKQWNALLPADMAVLSMIAYGKKDIYGKHALAKFSESLGIEGNVNKTTIQNSLRRLEKQNLITKIDYGTYQFEDEAFSEWVKYKED